MKAGVSARPPQRVSPVSFVRIRVPWHLTSAPGGAGGATTSDRHLPGRHSALAVVRILAVLTQEMLVHQVCGSPPCVRGDCAHHALHPGQKLQDLRPLH